MLKLENISRSFPQRGIVLDKLHLEVEKGDMIAITGPSGSGKTTLLNILGLLDSPDEGEVTFNGTVISKLGQDEAARFRSENLGFVFQDNLLLPYLTVMENIELPLLAAGLAKSDRDARREYIYGLLEKCGISEIRGKMPNQVSGGEAQRATLVRALVNSPAILLADEPTGSLDAENTGILAELLIGMNREYGTTIITVTHSLSLANRMRRVYELKNGKLSHL